MKHVTIPPLQKDCIEHHNTTIQYHTVPHLFGGMTGPCGLIHAPSVIK